MPPAAVGGPVTLAGLRLVAAAAASTYDRQHDAARRRRSLPA